jgi:hypothetical protein
MKIIARPRGTNKTKELLTLANENHGLVLTTEPHALQVKANAYNLKDLTIIDWATILYDEFDASRPIYIHKAEDVFKEFMKLDFNLSLEGMSISVEE